MTRQFRVSPEGHLIAETAKARWYLEEMPHRPVPADFVLSERATFVETDPPEYCANAIVELLTGDYAGHRAHSRISLTSADVLAIEMAVAGRA